MSTKCAKPSEIYVNKWFGVAVLKCFSCGFTQEIGPGADVPVIAEIEEKDHHSGKWKRVE